MFKMHKRASFFTAAAFSLLSGLSVADDTEIYVGGANLAEGVVFPNVLLILDTSSSMNSEDGLNITRLDRMKEALRQLISSSNNVNMGLMRFHSNGGPVLYPLANIHQPLDEAEPETGAGGELSIMLNASTDDAVEAFGGAVILDEPQLEMVSKPDDSGASGSVAVDVAHQDDDAEERVSDGQMENLGSSDLEFLHEFTGDASSLQRIGVRFPNVDIPQGADIQSARIRFDLDADKGKNDPVSIDIYGEKSANAARFTSATHNIGERLQNRPTNNVVSWEPETGIASHAYFYADSLEEIVGEIVGLGDWASGNPMVFLFEHVAGSGIRTAGSTTDNGTPDDPPRLEVTYTTGSGNDIQQTVGLRFSNVMVPQGATVTSARIEFQAAQNHADSANLTISAQDVDDAPTFSSAVGDISGRTTTSSVAWDSVEPWTIDQRYQSPDLTSAVQQVVNRDGWCGGQAMAFIISGDAGALRVAAAIDGDTTAAPVLHLTYDTETVPEDACIDQTFQAQVVSGSDDAEEDTDGVIDMTSTDLELVQESTIQTVGVRFRNVRIPQGTEIVHAELVFTTDETSTGGTSLTIEGEAVDDSAPFSTASGNLSGRTPRTRSVSWSPDPWNTVGETHATPDVGEIVDDIVSRPGWQSGNAMTFLITGSGKRVAESYDGDGSSAPRLVVQVRGSLDEDGGGERTVRDKLLEIVDAINYKSGTPILDTLYEAASYYRGEAVHYGKTRGFGGDVNDVGGSCSRCQHTRLSHPASYTGGTIVRPAGCSADNPSDSDCINEYISGDPQYTLPITESCQANYQILLSDGNGYGTQSVSLVNSNILETGYACANSHDQCSVELARFLHREDQTDAHEEDQTVTTYTIGFNLQSTSPDFLTDVADAGGGSFHTADTAAELAEVFQAILSEIISRSTSFTAPAVSVNAFNRLFHDNDIYFSLFMPERSVRWNGNLKKYTICPGGEGANCTRGEILDSRGDEAIGANNRFDPASQSFWSLINDGNEVMVGGAGENVPAYTARKIYTYAGGGAPSNVGLNVEEHTISVDDDDNDASDPLRSLLGAATLPDGQYSELVHWIIGRDVKDEDDDGATNDDRWSFADPLHSQPLVITYGQESGGDPVKKIFIGSNEGALRMVNATTGVEEWAFIPQEMLERQSQMMTNASGDHLYGMDGSPSAWIKDVDEDGIIEPGEGDKVWIFVGMRRGGRNIYALDVTPGSTLSNGDVTGGITPILKWRIQGGVSSGFDRLGQTWSTPRVTKIPYGDSQQDVLMFAGGYDTGQDSGFGCSNVGNAIYLVDIDDGSLVARVTGSGTADCPGTDVGATLVLDGMDYPIPSDLALLDSNGDGATDRLYVGDTGGQVWRLDLDDNDTGVTLSGARLAAISDPASDTEKRKFFYPPDVAIVYDSDHSTISEFDMVVMVSGNRAHPTDTTVHNRVYAFRDYTITGAIPQDFASLTEDDLFDTTDNLVQEGTDAQKETILTEMKGKHGWRIDLREESDWIGEKGLSSPIILAGKMFFTTYLPASDQNQNQNLDDACSAPVEGSGRLYALNILNGAAVYINWDGTGDLANYTKEDRDYDLWGGIPSGVVAVFQPEGVTLVIGGGGGGGSFDPNIELPIVRTFWLQPR